MTSLQKHLRNTFITGIFSAIPLAATVFVIVYVERATREPLKETLGINIPFVGVIAAIALIYLLGLGVSSLIGRFFLRAIDKLLLRVPLLKDLYQAWKHVALTPGGKEGTFAKVVLVAVGSDQARLIGFTSGEALPGDPESCCVFVPNAPNPINGRLYFVPRNRCSPLDITADDAFKILLSNGNYVPAQVAL